MISKDEIMQLSNGTAIDILVAEQVMGWQRETDQYRLTRLDRYFAANANRQWWRKPDGGWYDSPPPYSSDMAAAWQVVERMNSRGQAIFLLTTCTEHKVAFTHPSEEHPDYIMGKTVAGAICKAALVATM